MVPVIGLLAQVQATFEVVVHGEAGVAVSPGAQSPGFGVGWIALLVAVGFVALLVLRRITRRFRRRERETTERALWALSGYYPTTRVFRRFRYGHDRRGRRR